jgi:hypothetical protein
MVNGIERTFFVTAWEELCTIVQSQPYLLCASVYPQNQKENNEDRASSSPAATTRLTFQLVSHVFKKHRNNINAHPSPAR